MESSGKMPSDDDDDIPNPSALLSIASTLSRLKRKVLANRAAEVTEKMRGNSRKIQNYTIGLFSSAMRGGADEMLPKEERLTFRGGEKVLCNFSSPDMAGNDGKDDALAAPIIFGSSAAGKTAVRPTKLSAQANVPPYTTWIYLDRNQRMTEDQSVQGRRRIYYDPIGNETLIASDSEEEEPEEEEPKHDFTKGEDFIIWAAVQEQGASASLFEQISQTIRVKREEIEARYELLLKDVDKQARCEAHGAGLRMKSPPLVWPPPVGRRKGTRDLVRLTYKETKPDTIEYIKADTNGATRKLDDEKIEAKDLVAAMDSFDNLFCRRCLVFDCRLHGCSQPLVHPSERQPPANTDLEASVPCGPDCYLLSQRGRIEAPLLCSPGVAESRPGDGVPCTAEDAENAERARVARSQNNGETSCSGDNLGSANALCSRTAGLSHSPSVLGTSRGDDNLKSANAHCSRTAGLAHSTSALGKLLKLSVNGDDKNVKPGRTAETLLVLSSKDGSASVKKELISVTSSLTAHKKLARSAVRKSIEENGEGRSGGSGYNDVIDLSDDDGQFPPEDGSGLLEQAAAEKMTKAGDGMRGFEQLLVKQGEDLLLQHERARFSSTKKLARSTKRALEDNLQSSFNSLHEAEAGTEVRDGPLKKKQARTTENGAEDTFSGGVSTPPRAAEVVKMDVWMGSDLVIEKDKKGRSPKKLARSARKPNAERPLDPIEGQAPLSIGKALVPSPEAEKPVKDEKIRNSAARKLARSARKVREKVAVAIQQQQLQSTIEVVNKRRVERREAVKEERHDADVTEASQVPAICSAKVSIAVARVEKSQAHSPNADKTAGPAKVGTHGKAVASKNEEAHERAEFADDWTPLEKGLYEKGQQIFGKSSCVIAKTMLKGCKTCAEVREYIEAQDAAEKRGLEGGLHQFPDSLACVLKWDVARARARFYGRRKGSRKLKFTLKSAGNAIRKRLANGKDAPQRQYTPCGCLFTCGKQCPCQLSGTCCEKYCGCAKSCKNRFRGCHCAKSQCCSRQCPCFAAGRECDPDVCRNCWIGCGDGKVAGPPVREDKDNYQCHNMKLLLKQQQRVLLSRSDVAGWGAFLKNTVSKHDYLGEYTGELISHREADKRGKIYDRENSSFLFNLNDKYVLDACRKGDKLKFANHSPNPNCYAKVIMVAGDHRVGIFANERILAGEELFYDYRYEAERAPVWARRGESSGNGKKDDSAGPSERRSKQAS